MYTGSPWTHGGFRALSDEERRDRGYDSGIGLVEQRLDGFVSADAAYTGGTLTTPPLRFLWRTAGTERRRGRHRAGEGRDPGRGRPAAPRLRTRTLPPRHGQRHAPHRELGRLTFARQPRRRPIRLHFDMRSAKLYAFQFR